MSHVIALADAAKNREIARLRRALAVAEAKLADEVRHADALYAALDEVMTFTLEDFPNMDASHPKACVTPAYRRANVAGVAALKAHAARRAGKEETR